MKVSSALRIALWLVGMLCAAWIVARARYTADLSAFLPRAPSARQQLLVDELREGPASRLLLVGIAGGDSAVRAQVSAYLVRYLQHDPAFTSISNGAVSNGERERDLILDALRAGNGNRREAAESLGISARTLRYKLARLREAGIDVPTS